MESFATSRNQICPASVAFTANARSKVKRRWKITTLKINAILEFNALSRHHAMNSEKIRLNNKLRDILLNKCNDNIKLVALGYGLLGILLTVACNFALTFWPMHNVFESPEYWHEMWISYIMGYGPVSTAILLKSFVMLVGLEEVNSWKVWRNMYAVSTFTYMTITTLAYGFWVFICKKRWPMPMYGQSSTFGALIAMNVTLWFQYQKKWRSNPLIKRRILLTISMYALIAVGEVCYKSIQNVYRTVPENMLWTLVIVLIIARECLAWGLTYVGTKIWGSQDLSAKIFSIYFAALRHAMFLNVSLGSLMTTAASWTMLAVDFLINIKSTISTIRHYRRNTEESTDKQIDALMSVIFNETVECIMPIAYCICLLMAYFGPNAELLGNIKNGNWNYTAIEDISDACFWLIVLFIVDLGSLLICIILLKVYCKMNNLKMFLQVLEQIGPFLALYQAYMVTEVCYLTTYAN